MTSLFITLGKPILVGGVLYNYKDVVYNKNVDINNNIDFKKITNILTEGQVRAKMDYCFRNGMHVFIRIKSASKEFTYMGTANMVEDVREWSDSRPAMYHIELKPTEMVDPVCRLTPEMLLYKTSYKIAAFIHVGLPIPMKCSLDSGVFDHDPNYNSADHKLRRTSTYRKKNNNK